ncbi:Hint domain-containing protein [Pseudophaeobacter sp.]|uniref:Hint domain-containing protein n=1 Tax=Pseudophaeobacter sp. TaxID=1971739 RepID=UPI0032969105
MTAVDHAIQSIPAYPAEQFRVEIGANMGDPLGVLDELMLDDIYQLSPPDIPQRLTIHTGSEGSFSIAQDSELGEVGAALHLDCSLTLMPHSGDNVEALVMVEVDADEMIAGIYLLPMAPLNIQQSYTLVRAERDNARRKLAQMACVSFTRGTRITLATGAQKPIEELQAGDRILTRDDGVQELRWIGQSTARAVGRMAPVLIRAGALNNANDLLVSPDHRLMVYQRQDALGTGCPELLLRARDLVNGDTVMVQDGGFVDYFHLLFDRHHIVYAEGIAAESLFLDALTQPALPDEILTRISEQPEEMQRRDAHGLEVQKALLDRPDAVDLLKRSSLR